MSPVGIEQGVTKSPRIRPLERVHLLTEAVVSTYFMLVLANIGIILFSKTVAEVEGLEQVGQ